MSESYDLIQQQVDLFQFGSRTRSAALLAWFMAIVWRMDPEDVETCICDGTSDKGIDGLVVNRDIKEIVVFQSRHVETSERRQGDTKLQQFRGVDTYFRNPESIDALLASNPAPELVLLLKRSKVRELLEEGDWNVRLEFVTDAEADPVATAYIDATRDDSPSLDLWDRTRLAPIARRTAEPNLLDERVTLHTDGAVQQDLGEGTAMAIGVVPASDLVALPGIENLTIFDLNVRLSMGRTRINRELRDTINEAGQHRLFPAYHNGLTLLTRAVSVGDDGRAINLDRVSVVNGCQSLVSLYEARQSITDDLKLLVKVIQLGEEPALADLITYRTNNQNPVNIRDQRATNPIQRDLQDQVHAAFGNDLFYRIREGERSGATEVLDNRLAAQLLMAVYVEEPWRAVRKVRLFDEEYYRIFARDVDAYRLYLLHLLNTIIESERGRLRGDLEASFASVRFTIAFLTRHVVALSEAGSELFHNPMRWLPDKKDEVTTELRRLVGEVIDSINFHVQHEQEEATQEGEPYDPKTVFKSRDGVKRLENAAVRDAKRAAERHDDFLFAIEP